MLENYLKRRMLLAIILLAFAATACHSPNTNKESTPSNLLVLNAPASGEVRRVLFAENTAVDRGATIIEIEALSEGTSMLISNAAQPASRVGSIQSNLRDARAVEAEVHRTNVEVSRVEALVSSGAAPQSQLDAAQAEYQRAQERLQAQARSASAVSKSSPAQQANSVAPNAEVKSQDQLVMLRAPASGVVRVITVRAGQRVAAGQPLVTISTNKR